MSHSPYPYTETEKALAEGCSWLSELLLPIDERSYEDPNDIFDQISSYFSNALNILEYHGSENVQVGTAPAEGYELEDYPELPIFEKRVTDPKAMEAHAWLEKRLNGLENISAIPDPLTADTVMLIIDGYREQCARQLAWEKRAMDSEIEYEP